MIKPTVINMAEAIIERFWDVNFKTIKSWIIEDGSDHGLDVRAEEGMTEYAWSRKPIDGPALSMFKKMQVDCTGYDKVILSIKGPENARYKFIVQTEKEELIYESVFMPSPVKEYFFDLSGACRIESMHLSIYAENEGIDAGWINWIGLQNSFLLESYLKQWESFDEKWDLYIKPESYEPLFTPYYGIIINQEELEVVREKHKNYIDSGKASPFIKAAEKSTCFIPEKMIGEFVNLFDDTRFCRDREYGRVLLLNGMSAAVAGVLLKDAKLIRLAARYAMSLALCEHWDDGMICDFPGGISEHRCFTETFCLDEIGHIMDLAGDMFTDAGRNLLLRRIAKEGIASINFIAWKHDYIFNCNQLAMFSPGRMLGYAILSKHQPRVIPYMELAYRDIIENLNKSILPDGGYVEGPAYSDVVGEFACRAIYYYAKAKGISFKEAVSDSVLRMGPYAEAVMSSSEDSDFIHYCDGNGLTDILQLAIMAVLLPESHWTTLYKKAASRNGCIGDSLFLLKLESEISNDIPEMNPLVVLPDTFLASSYRIFGEYPVKLLILGSTASKIGGGHNHEHEDKGSFVLEFAGETFALDAGSCDYSSPLHIIYRNAQRHNMLVPFGTVDRPHPNNPIMTDVKAVCTGDETVFSAVMDVSPGWEEYYSKWIRTWKAPSPDVLVIEDDYVLMQGEGVEFYWNTMLQVEIIGDNVLINGKLGMAKIQIPADCTVRIDSLPLLGGDVQKRITICRKGRSGKLCIKVQLLTKC